MRFADALIPRFGEAVSSGATGVFIWILQAELQDVQRRRSSPARTSVFERAKINLGQTQWYAPELRRIRGELALGNDEGLAVARQYFLSALELSASQGSLSVGAQGCDQPSYCPKSRSGRKGGAWRALQATHAKFREGLEPSIYGLAKQVLPVSKICTMASPMR